MSGARRSPRLVEKFIRVTRERVSRLAGAFDAMAAAPGQEERTREVARELHTLKGEAKLMGYVAISRIAHAQEEILATAIDRDFAEEDPASSLLRDGLQLVGRLADLEPDDPEATSSAADYLSRAEALVAREATEAPPASKAASAPSTEMAPPSESVPNPGVTPAPAVASRLAVTLPAPSLEHGPRPVLEAPSVTSRASSLRVEVDRLEEMSLVTEEVRLAQSQLVRWLKVLGKVELEAEEVMRDLNGLIAIGAEDDGQVETQRLRETVASARNRQDLMLRQLKDTRTHLEEAVGEGRAGFGKLETELQTLRLVPLASLFDVYPLAVRELSREQHKQVRLDVAGADIEVDAGVLEHLEEPLLHIIRNAVDHGIETPEARRAIDKPEVARLELSASQRAGFVRIVVRDDGRGVDPARVAAVAVSRGLISPGEESRLSPARAHELLFSTGLSTRTETSEVSGRGLGLDIVKSRIEAMGGMVQLSSRRGRGTTLTIAVPATVLRVPILLVEVAAGIYGIPSSEIHSVATVEADAIREDGARPYVRVHEQNWPLESLGGLLHGSRVVGRRTQVLLLEHQARRVAVRVDRLLREESLIVRRLPDMVADCRLASGTALSTDGRLVLLLNVAEIIRAASRHVEAHVAPRAKRGPKGCVLVVDDSELTRDMLVSLVEDGGYEVMEAVDGREALERLAVRTPDVILTDLEMPVMDGFELLGAVRQDTALRRIPVVVCSTRGSDQDKQRAAELGADAYVVKAQFSSEVLLRTLARFQAGERS